MKPDLGFRISDFGFGKYSTQHPKSQILNQKSNNICFIGAEKIYLNTFEYCI